MFELLDTLWPIGHGNLECQMSAPGVGYPTTTPKVVTARLDDSFLGATGICTFPEASSRDFAFYTTDFPVAEHQQSHIRKLVWDARTGTLTQVAEDPDFLGLLVMVQRGSQKMIIGANGLKSGRRGLRLEQLSPDLNQDPGGKSKMVRRSSRQRFSGTVKGLTMLRNPAAIVVVTAGRNGATLYTYDLSSPHFEWLAEPQTVGSMSGRIAVDRNNRLYFSVETSKSEKLRGVGGKIRRMRFDESSRTYVLDGPPTGDGSAEFSYSGHVSGSTPTILGDRVLFTNNTVPSSRKGKEFDLTIFSLNKDDFGDFDEDDHTARPFPRTTRQRTSAFSGSSLNGYKYPRKKGGFVISHSWADIVSGDSDPRAGVARVDVDGKGKLSVVWKDPQPGLKRFGCLASKGKLLTYSYHKRKGSQTVRAVWTGAPAGQVPDGLDYPAPEEAWEAHLPGPDQYMGCVAPGKRHFIVTNSRGVHALV